VFGQADSDAVVRSVVLRPTLGMEIGLFRESRSLPFMLNTKRQAVVRLEIVFFFSKLE
jgi:hypothetical protein